MVEELVGKGWKIPWIYQQIWSLFLRVVVLEGIEEVHSISNSFLTSYNQECRLVMEKRTLLESRIPCLTVISIHFSGLITVT